jgi:hypothetical protein
MKFEMKSSGVDCQDELDVLNAASVINPRETLLEVSGLLLGFEWQ